MITAQDVMDETVYTVPSCHDCGMPYTEMGMDVVLPNYQWNGLVKPDDRGIILCANCIVSRASKMPGVSPSIRLDLCDSARKWYHLKWTQRMHLHQQGDYEQVEYVAPLAWCARFVARILYRSACWLWHEVDHYG